MNVPGVPHDEVPPRATIDYVHTAVIPAAMSFLLPRFDSFEARTMLLAIGLQESRFAARRQINGPARSFWEFEEGGGVRGVMEHPDTGPALDSALALLQYDRDECWDALPHNDVLACIFARLLLWTNPAQIPEDERNAWAYYLATWRPGRPRPDTWSANFQRAVAMVAA